MKQQIKLPKKVLVMIYSLFGLIILFGIFYFSNNYLQWKKEIGELTKQRITGRIIKVKDLSRGNVSIMLDTDSNKQIQKTSLPIAWEIEKFGIRHGDSLYKDTDSEKIIFYRGKGKDLKTLGEALISL